ncbi:MAG: M13 family metallopeptidase [Rikenellaceae bacterium]|nr:M13 family metallopeptidase [Rikenellaceae bacterium]
MTSCNCGAGRSSAIDPANLDTTVAPGVDFYRFACGGWLETHPMTDEYSRFGSFDRVREMARNQVRQLIEELAKGDNTTLGRKIGDMFNVAMDSAKLNSDGYLPIVPMLETIDKITTKEDLQKVAADMQRNSFDCYFAFYVGADDRNSAMNILHTYQGGLGLGQRDYYVDDDPDTREIMAKYREHIGKMFTLCGFDEQQAAQAVADVLEIETRIAVASSSMVELRDPQANYHKMTIEQLGKTIPGIDWAAMLENNGIGTINSLNVSQIAPLQECGRIISSLDVAKQKNYLRWVVINEAASYLSDAIVAQNFDFYGRTFSGKKELRPRWKRAVDAVDGVLSEALGELYVKKYFPPKAKTRMLTLVEGLRTSLAERIDALEWMGEQTKRLAHEKLSTFIVKVGYPDKWRDYSALEIRDDSFWANIMRARRFESDYRLAKLGKPVDRSEWHMAPQTVNAYYNPGTNEICFPAGILQPPFFDMKADDAANYGAIGVVIGHEMTHGFDDSGRQYDKDGNLRDWWTADDAAKFESRAKVLADQFDAIEVLPGLNANGQLTLGENIADNGGLQVSYQAFKKATADAPLETVGGFTPEQRFFLSYAGVWAGHIRDEEARRLTIADPHSLGKWRVDGALPNIDAWYEAFGVVESDPMFVPVDKRARIW